MPENRRVRATAVGALIALTVGLFSLDYTVQRGDTLGKIARDHDVSLSELIEANDINNPNLIFPGQTLVIPGEEEDAEPVVHVVVRGDTLSRIAAAYDTTISALVDANAISNPNLIRVGQSIIISPGSPPDAPTITNDPMIRSGQYHIVARGEDLEEIAALYPGITPERIALANGIVGNVIYAGTRLFIDGPGFVAEGSEGVEVYTVVRGDRLGDIAARSGVSVDTLIDLNGISDPNFIPTGQAWICPVEGAKFFNDWGFPRGGGSRWHEGNDLFADRGTPVYAPVSGTVEQKVGKIGGNQVNLQGDDGVLYINSHLSEFGKSGEVYAGDIIGYVGTTGSAVGTRPHVHFMMYVGDDLVVNPYPTLVRHCKG